MVERYQSLVMIDINNKPILALDPIKPKLPILNSPSRQRKNHKSYLKYLGVSSLKFRCQSLLAVHQVTLKSKHLKVELSAG